jgi:hypothetical protein
MDIKRLLNKKGWTGRELGIIELTNMAVQFRQALQGEELKPLIETSQLQKMVNEIKDPVQGRTYNGYIAVHEWLALKYNIAQTQMQQAQLQYRTLEGLITTAILAEDVYSYIEQLPAIMTQKQYDKSREEGIEAYLTDENGEDLQSDIFNLIERATAFYLHKLQTEPKKPNPLKAIRKKYIAQPVKSKLILDSYNEVTGEGYYTLEDGRRSDQMTGEEWKEALTTPKMKEALDQIGATDGSGTYYPGAIAQQRLLDRSRVIFNGGTEEEADEAQKKADYERGFAVPVKWHTYTEPPTDLTKWDIIEQELLLTFYPASLDGEDPYTESNFNASMEDFKKEFSDLVTAMLSDMDKRYFKGDKVQASKLPVKEWGATLISWRRLYELDFYGERKEAESDISIFNGNKRALFNGVAIIRPSDILNKSRRIDEQGYYIEPETQSSLENFSLEAFFTEAEDYATNIEVMETSRETFLDSYYFIISYNYAIDRIAAIYDVPELEVFKMSIEELSDRIDIFNNLVPVLYRRIKNTDYSDKELQAKKLQVLKDYFQPVEYKALAIPETSKKQIEELLEDFKAFKPENSNRFYNLLCTRPKTEEERA